MRYKEAQKAESSIDLHPNIKVFQNYGVGLFFLQKMLLFSKIKSGIKDIYNVTKDNMRIISESGSCDTEYWNDDAENSALCYRNELHKKYIQNTLNVKYFRIILFLMYFLLKINTAVVSLRDVFLKHLTNHKVYNVSNLF